MSKEEIINKAYDANNPESAKDVVLSTIESLDKGQIRICEKVQGNWQVNEWVKKAILLYFKLSKIKPMTAGDLHFLDKIPVKEFGPKDEVRVVPHAVVRYGAYVDKGAVLMPSYVNIGARVGSGTMVDTWATVGSCASIGKNVHLSGGVGIGGVLEPLQARPVVVEDNVFIGSRCIVVEGVIIEEGAILGAGVTITKSTPIVDVRSKEAKYIKGKVPKNSVVIPGTRKKTFPSGDYYIPCAMIIGERTKSSDKKTSLTSALREFDIQA